ncbi:hypothetical protein [Actinokineospora sp. NBRC 105648]|uniref:hypothetical protein n=1 Tax=Actinokineospora sp. NBRC 105648 TaxID=3032206 RepID=UPI0024A23E14|nr:hypothetical protein [Actinokineospora sp. NBRC 105648]GLZ42832.1 hypothetical protein Acsp05_64560 [Actinokineospora sp. NBRC 105648]
MLIAFEGLGGAGVSSLVRSVHTELTRRGVPASRVPEFSHSEPGHRLLAASDRDWFPRGGPDEVDATALTRALEVVADLYYLDERVIEPALDRGEVVLKDRHRAGVLSSLVPDLVASGAIEGESRAIEWLAALVSQVRHHPTVTVFVLASPTTRLDRLRARARRAGARPRHSDEDVGALRRREFMLRGMLPDHPGGVVTIDNGARPLEVATGEVVELVMARRDPACGERVRR